MSNYQDGMGRSWMLDARDVTFDIECPKCGAVSEQDLEEFDGTASGLGVCNECEHEWNITTSYNRRDYYDYDYD